MDPGFDATVLSEFRSRLVEGHAEYRLIEKVLEACRERGLLKKRGRQRTDSTHVLGAVRELNRLELIAETMRAALNAIAVAAPDWLRRLAPPEWYERYGRRIEDANLPESKAERKAYAEEVGRDGAFLLAALEHPHTPEGLQDLSAVEALRLVWGRHFVDDAPQGGGPLSDVRLRSSRQLSRAAEAIESPYDLDVRFRSKSGRNWTGYMVHFTETCDADAPRLLTHAETTPASVHEAMRTAVIHEALAEKGLPPSEHLVDAGYVAARHLVESHERHGIDLVGPARGDPSHQRRAGDGYGIEAFEVDWEQHQVRCPQGKLSTSWHEYENETPGLTHEAP